MMKNGKLLQSIRTQIGNNAGETLAETLVSVLVSTLALLMLATAIGTTVNIIMTSRGKMEEIYGNESATVSSSPTSQGTVSFDIPIEPDASSTDINVYTTGEGSPFYTRKVVAP